MVEQWLVALELAWTQRGASDRKCARRERGKAKLHADFVQERKTMGWCGDGNGWVATIGLVKGTVIQDKKRRKKRKRSRVEPVLLTIQIFPFSFPF